MNQELVVEVLRSPHGDTGVSEPAFRNLGPHCKWGFRLSIRLLQCVAVSALAVTTMFHSSYALHGQAHLCSHLCHHANCKANTFFDAGYVFRR